MLEPSPDSSVCLLLPARKEKEDKCDQRVVYQKQHQTKTESEATALHSDQFAQLYCYCGRESKTTKIERNLRKILEVQNSFVR